MSEVALEAKRVSPGSNQGSNSSLEGGVLVGESPEVKVKVKVKWATANENYLPIGLSALRRTNLAVETTFPGPIRSLG